MFVYNALLSNHDVKTDGFATSTVKACRRCLFTMHFFRITTLKPIGGPPQRYSSYNGVTYNKNSGKWEARIYDKGKTIYCGVWDSEKGAADSWDAVAMRSFPHVANKRGLNCGESGL